MLTPRCGQRDRRSRAGLSFIVDLAYFSNMPSKTPKQRRTMAAAAHNPAFARKVGIPTKVAKEFNREDQRKGRKAKGRK